VGALAAGGAALVTGWAAYAAVTWRQYGKPRPPLPEEGDDLLDQYMPSYDVVDRHHVQVSAPSTVTLAAARDMDLLRMPVVRVIFKGRELLLRAKPESTQPRRGIVATVLSLGWVVLAETPGREIVFGAVTQPWQADVTFRSIPAASFAAFDEPGYVKIVWNLRADPIDASRSVFRTETRAVATDAAARLKFRRYWSVFAPGITLIRRMSLGPLKTDAEQRARSGVKDTAVGLATTPLT
jgi:hypothetical protein